MLSKRKFHDLRNALISHARAATLEKRHLATLPVPFMYRFGELHYIEKWRQPGLLVEARNSAEKAPSVKVSWALTSMLALITCYALAMPPLDLSWPALWAIATALLLPAYLHRRQLMQQYIWRKT